MDIYICQDDPSHSHWHTQIEYQYNVQWNTLGTIQAIIYLGANFSEMGGHHEGGEEESSCSQTSQCRPPLTGYGGMETYQSH